MKKQNKRMNLLCVRDERRVCVLAGDAEIARRMNREITNRDITQSSSLETTTNRNGDATAMLRRSPANCLAG